MTQRDRSSFKIALSLLLSLAIGLILPFGAAGEGDPPTTGQGGSFLVYVYLPTTLNQAGPGPSPVYPNDTYFSSEQWGLNNTGQYGGILDADIDAPEAWGYTTGSNTVIVAIVDTGIDTSHPEFSGRLLPGKHFFDNGSSDNNVSDDKGHGTHVAGIAAANGNNGTGVAGVAWGVKILPIKVLSSSGQGYTSDVVAGINWAVSNGAKVINLSMGSTNSNSSLQAAINNAYSHGILVVASAGNCGDQYYPYNGCSYQSQPSYPAAGSHVLAVAATDPNDDRASFSTVGSYVDVAAPGWDIYSTWPTSIRDSSGYYSGYDWDSGTSMAAPFVTGLAALLYSRYPNYTPDQIAQAILQNADSVGGYSGHNSSFGCGRINAANALANGISDGSACPGWSALSATVSSAALPDTLPTDSYRPGVVLVRFKSGATSDQQLQSLEAHGLTILSTITDLDIHQLAVPIGQELEMAKTLSADPQVEFAEPDYMMSVID